MDRRKSLKTLIAGSLGTALVLKSSGCDTPEKLPVSETEAEVKGYGLRTGFEARHDELVRSAEFFTDAELTALGIIADIIVPGDGEHPKATDTEITDFFEFIAKDLPTYHQTKMRGGVMWLNSESSRRFDGKSFVEITPEQRIQIVDDIAWPEKAEGTPMEAGAEFFSHMRFLTLTGFYTSKAGIKYLGYVGNSPNVWDGVPQDVLDEHGLSYDDDMLPKYVDQAKRNVLAEWDENGNLLT